MKRDVRHTNQRMFAKGELVTISFLYSVQVETEERSGIWQMIELTLVELGLSSPLKDGQLSVLKK